MTVLGVILMTHTHSMRSRVLRRVGVAVATAIAISTVASTGSSAATAPNAPKYGGKVKVAIFDTFPGFCFGDNNANSALMVQRTVYETLFEKTKGNDMVGLLAQSASASDDLKTWTIKLKPNIKFSDGVAFDATAVKQNLEYAGGGYSAAVGAAEAATADFAGHAVKLFTAFKGSGPLGGTTGAGLMTEVGIPVAGQTTTVAVPTLSFLTVLGVFAKDGAIDTATKGALNALGLTKSASSTWAASTYTLSTGTAFLANIVSVTATDALTVTLKLNRAQNDVPAMLYASGRSFMRSPSQFTKGATVCSQKPIGTGPFKVADDYKLVSTDQLTVYKNPTYWRTDPTTKAKLPYLDQITFTNVKEASQRAAAIRKGTYDAGMFSGASEGTFIKDLRLRKTVAKEYKSPNEYYPSIWLNQGKVGSPFASKNARLAVLSCMDRENFVKVRTKGESIVAKSIVGASSIMYSTNGFQKFNVTASKGYVAAWQAEAGNAGKSLSFSYPVDTSTLSMANATFLKYQWAKCGITANLVVEETALIIKKAFNSAASGGAANAYDAISILLFEGTDVSFNMPFALTNAYPAGATTMGSTWRSNIGNVLGLNHHSDTAIDDLFYAGQAAANKSVAKIKFQEATARLQSEGVMGAISNNYYTFFTNNTKGLAGIGALQLVKGKTQRVVTNWGIDWTGVYKTA
jgi:ABC-type transport system substrate-binding protein